MKNKDLYVENKIETNKILKYEYKMLSENSNKSNKRSI